MELSKDEDFVRFKHNMRLSDDQIQQLPQDFVKKTPLHDNTCWRNEVALWSPEHPTLYDLTIRLFDASGQLIDEVQTTTGMRSLNWTKATGPTPS